LDTAQNLWVGVFGFNSQSALFVLPYATTTLYGIDVSANVFSFMFDTSGICHPGALAFDAYQNLFLCETTLTAILGSQLKNDVFILPRQDSTLYQHIFPANVISSLSGAGLDTYHVLGFTGGLAFDAQNNLFVSNFLYDGSAALVVLPPYAIPPPVFPYCIFGYFYTTDTTYLFSQTSVQRFVAGYTGGAPLQTPPVGTPLQDTGRRVYVFGSNRLRTHTFYEILRKDTLEAAYVCVWTASGIPPSSL